MDNERMRKRLRDYTGGKAKMERFLKADPNSSKAPGWKKRLAEYEEAIAVLQPKVAALEDVKSKH